VFLRHVFAMKNQRWIYDRDGDRIHALLRLGQLRRLCRHYNYVHYVYNSRPCRCIYSDRTVFNSISSVWSLKKWTVQSSTLRFNPTLHNLSGFYCNISFSIQSTFSISLRCVKIAYNIQRWIHN
jgi:hypothetical protein